MSCGCSGLCNLLYSERLTVSPSSIQWRSVTSLHGLSSRLSRLPAQVTFFLPAQNQLIQIWLGLASHLINYYGQLEPCCSSSTYIYFYLLLKVYQHSQFKKKGYNIIFQEHFVQFVEFKDMSDQKSFLFPMPWTGV